MMTSWYRNFHRITGPLWGESPGSYPSQNAMQSFDVFIYSRFEQAVDETVGLQLIWDAMPIMWRH